MKNKKEPRWYWVTGTIVLIGWMVALILIMDVMEARAAEQDQDTYIKAEYKNYCIEIGGQYCIFPELLEAIIEHESSGQATAVNGNCKGLMQVNESYHLERMDKLAVTNLYDPYSNILIATDYISELFKKYEDIGTVLMVYNGTRDAVERGEQGDYTEYANAIMKRSAELERMHGK